MDDLWEPKILLRYHVKGLGNAILVAANRLMSRDHAECMGEHIIVDGQEVVVTGVERNLPGTPIRVGEEIGLLIAPVAETMIDKVKAAMLATDLDVTMWDDGPLTELARAAIEATLASADMRTVVRAMDETKLTGIVMTLTGGSANPAVVRAHIARLRAETPSA